MFLNIIIEILADFTPTDRPVGDIEEFVETRIEGMDEVHA
jgi:hypothetical protein